MTDDLWQANLVVAAPDASRPLISVVAGCRNEEGNVEELCRRIKAVFEQLPQYRWELIFIDNASTDRTAERLRHLASIEPSVKVILNLRDFGQLRSPYHAIMQARGDAVIAMASDFQDPPEMLVDFLALWASGSPVVMGVKTSSEEPWVIYQLRTLYYKTLKRFAGLNLVQHATGFGCYDRRVIEELRRLPDATPYLRGLVAELGFPIATVPFEQPRRRWGVTKNNFYTLYDIAMLGFTTHSRVPLRLAVFTGFGVAGLSLLVAFAYLVAKLVLWDNFPNIGQAPTVIGLFFLGGVQLVFTGILGEYIGAIHTQVLRRPFAVEKERLNFDSASAPTVSGTVGRT
jgi:glycosyltransferase involved in cell wall biosynthesis